MSVKNDLQEMLKAAVRSSDGPKKNVIRMLRAKVEQELLSKGLPRDTDDDKVFFSVIASYRKAISKAVDMFKRSGKGDSELAISYRYEIDFCDGLLPKAKSMEETREIVRTKITELGASGAKDTGKVIKAVLADYPGEVDSSLAARAAKDLL